MENYKVEWMYICPSHEVGPLYGSEFVPMSVILSSLEL